MKKNKDDKIHKGEAQQIRQTNEHRQQEIKKLQ